MLKKAGKALGKAALDIAGGLAVVGSAAKATAQAATGNLPVQKAYKAKVATQKAKGLGVAGGSTGVKKMAKKVKLPGSLM